MKKTFQAVALVAGFLLMGASSASPDKSKVILTSDNMVLMDQTFTPASAAAVAQAAKELDSKLPSGEPIYLVLNSGGGRIDAGIELIANLSALNRPVHTVTLFSASMAFQTVQGLGDRLVLENGTLMSHKARGGFSGEFPGQLDSRYSYYLRLLTRLDKKTVARTNGKHTLDSYRALYENEYWCDGQDCVDQGFAERVVVAQCDASLSGTKEIVADKALYQGHVLELVVTLSQCPTITGPLSINIYVDGKPLFNSLKDLKEGTGTSAWTQANVAEVFQGMSSETISNIKKIIEDKLNQVGKREVVKGY